jgi:hypothetical protein
LVSAADAEGAGTQAGGAGGFSRYVSDAVQEQVRQDLLDDLAAELEAEYGPIPEELVEQARRQWPDYQE